MLPAHVCTTVGYQNGQSLTEPSQWFWGPDKSQSEKAWGWFIIGVYHINYIIYIYIVYILYIYTYYILYIMQNIHIHPSASWEMHLAVQIFQLATLPRISQQADLGAMGPMAWKACWKGIVGPISGLSLSWQQGLETSRWMFRMQKSIPRSSPLCSLFISYVPTIP